MSATIFLAAPDCEVHFPDGVDYEISDGVLSVHTATESRHYAPGAWLAVHEKDQ